MTWLIEYPSVVKSLCNNTCSFDNSGKFDLYQGPLDIFRTEYIQLGRLVTFLIVIHVMMKILMVVLI